MAKIEHSIIQLNADTFSNLESIPQEDANLLTPVDILSTFIPADNFIELNYLSLSGELITSIENYTNYSVLTGDTINGENGTKEISIDVLQDYKQYNPDTSEVVALYNFLDYPYSVQNDTEDFYIQSISPDRTEVRLVSVNLSANSVQQFTNTLIEKRDNSPYALNLFLYEGNNTFHSVVNIGIEIFRNTFGVLIKLLEPLPQEVTLKSRLNIVEKVSEPVAYRVLTTITEIETPTPTLRGANFDVEIETQSTEPSEYFNYNELFSFPTNNTNRQLNSLVNAKGAELSIDYTDYINFINFSSAEERVLNFKYKLDLIESYQTSLDSINSSTGVGVTGSALYFENLLDGIVDNLDHYERHLYYESGSSSWPKSNNLIPYTNQLSSTPEAITWFTNQKQVASLYDNQNPDILKNTIPTYLREDSANEPYNLFIDLIAQHFDNIWIYTDAVSDKYNADNRLDKGVSKDLVEDLLKNFGIKLYTSNRSTADLYRYFTLNSYDQGEEILPADGIISGSDSTPVSQQDYHREINKRIYHNLPLLLKSKGTERGIKALINCFGIPSDILKLKIYGGQSVNDLPFYGGEQPFTSSLDKIRTSNTGSIVSGDTLSYYTTISRSSNDVTQDLHRIEIGFAPSDNIDNYIVSQSAVLFPTSGFNIDDYIGDPRNTDTDSYRSLDLYRDAVLEGLDRYEVEDFIRLIKFFDNSIFRMVKDFIPARVVADTGIIIKQHLLERNKAISPVISWTQPEYSSSIQTGFITGSNAKAFESIGIGNVDGESKTNYNYTVQTPEGRRTRNDQLHNETKFDGEFSGSYLEITDGELNRANKLKDLKYDIVIYSGSFFQFIPGVACNLPTTPQSREIYNASTTFTALQNYPLPNLYGAPNGTYTYTVESVNVPSPFAYNFVPEGIGGYTQYEIFNTAAAGADYGPTCVSSREVQVVYCNMAKVDPSYNSGAPTSLSSLDTSIDISGWWRNTQANNFPIHVAGTIRYDIYNNGTLVSSAINQDAASIYDFSSFDSGTVQVRIYEPTMPGGDQPFGTSGPPNCFLEYTIPYTACALLHTGQVIGQTAINTEGESSPSDPKTYYSYIGPFNFQGTDNTTEYYAKLSYDPDPSKFGDAAAVQSGWEQITNTTAVSGVLSLATGDLAAVTTTSRGGINSLNTIRTYTLPGPNSYGSFTALVANTSVNAGDCKLQIKATSNSGQCEEYSLANVITRNIPPLTMNSISTWLNDNAAGSCCTQGAGNPIVWSLSSPTEFSDLNTPPSTIYSNFNGTIIAPTGYYKSTTWSDTTQGTARFWNNATATWGEVYDCTQEGTTCGT